jgi:hypothetical protein
LIVPVSSDCRFGLGLIPRVLQATSSFPYGNPVFLAGEFLDAKNLPWWYIPLALVAGMPVLILCFAFVGFIFGWTSRSLMKTPLRFGSLLLLTLQVLITPLAAIALGSVSYDANRHHLYVYPAVSVFAGLGLFLLAKRLGNLKWQRRWLPRSAPKYILAIFAGFALLLPLWESSRLLPYTYTYVNPVASLNGFETSWETDYWAVSLREAVSLVPSGAAFYVIGPPGSAMPFVNERGSRAKLSAAVPGSGEAFAVQIHRPSLSLEQPLAGCREVDRVERLVRGLRIPMSYLLVCDESVLKPYQRLPIQ